MLTFWYGLTSVLLGVVLFFPVRKLILNMNINRLQAKQNRKIKEEELTVLKKKAAVIAAIISVTFAFFYNKIIVIKFFTPS